MDENIEEKIKKFKELKKVRNQRSYQNNIEKRRETARNNYKYDGTRITCDVCNCEINKKSYLQHKLSDKHFRNTKEKENQ